MITHTLTKLGPQLELPTVFSPKNLTLEKLGLETLFVFLLLFE